MDRWAFAQSDPWLEIRRQLPVGTVFCVVRGPTRGRPCSTPAFRVQLRDAAAKAGVRRRFAPINSWSTRSALAEITGARRSW